MSYLNTLLSVTISSLRHKLIAARKTWLTPSSALPKIRLFDVRDGLKCQDIEDLVEHARKYRVLIAYLVPSMSVKDWPAVMVLGTLDGRYLLVDVSTVDKDVELSDKTKEGLRYLKGIFSDGQLVMITSQEEQFVTFAEKLGMRGLEFHGVDLKMFNCYDNLLTFLPFVNIVYPEYFEWLTERCGMGNIAGWPWNFGHIPNGELAPEQIRLVLAIHTSLVWLTLDLVVEHLDVQEGLTIEKTGSFLMKILENISKMDTGSNLAMEIDEMVNTASSDVAMKPDEPENMEIDRLNKIESKKITLAVPN